MEKKHQCRAERGGSPTCSPSVVVEEEEERKEETETEVEGGGEVVEMDCDGQI